MAIKKKLIGEFISIEKLPEAFAQTLKESLNLEDTLYKSSLPNYVDKFTLDLAVARTKKPLSDVGGGEKLFRQAHWYYLKILVKGTGTWTLIFELPNGDTVDLSESEVIKGDEILLEWAELKATNTVQAGETNPVFWVERRDIGS